MIEAMSLATGTVEIINHCKLETTRRQVCHPPRPPHQSHPRSIAYQNPPPPEPTLHIVAKNHTLWQRGTGPSNVVFVSRTSCCASLNASVES